MIRIKFVYVAALSWVAIQVSGCASSPIRMSSSEQIPAAEGRVETERTGNNNTKLDMEVEHLAPPQRVSANATTYIVWIHPLAAGRDPSSEGQIQSLGALRVDEDLKGKLSAITPFQHFELFVTAEPSALVQQPTGERLLWSQVTRE